VKLTTHLHQKQRSRMVEMYLHSSIRLHGVVVNYLSTGTTLPNPSSRTMALGSTQPLTEMSTSKIPRGKRAAGA
jgi:hypothetical protein